LKEQVALNIENLEAISGSTNEPDEISKTQVLLAMYYHLVESLCNERLKNL
jgi:hypothetical protein